VSCHVALNMLCYTDGAQYFEQILIQICSVYSSIVYKCKTLIIATHMPYTSPGFVSCWRCCNP